MLAQRVEHHRSRGGVHAHSKCLCAEEHLRKHRQSQVVIKLQLGHGTKRMHARSFCAGQQLL